MALDHTNTNTTRPGGLVLADALVAQGIDHVFAVPGESYLDVAKLLLPYVFFASPGSKPAWPTSAAC